MKYSSYFHSWNAFRAVNYLYSVTYGWLVSPATVLTAAVIDGYRGVRSRLSPISVNSMGLIKKNWRNHTKISFFFLSSTKDRVNRKINWSPSCTGRICSIQKVSERNCVSFPKPFVINIRTHARAHVGLGQVGNHSWGRRLALGQSCPGRRAERTSPDPARDSHLSRRRYLRPCAAVDARWCRPF